VRLLRPDGRLLAVAEPRADGNVKTLRVFGVAQADEPPDGSNETSTGTSPKTE
jgi:hypothetical protein